MKPKGSKWLGGIALFFVFMTIAAGVVGVWFMIKALPIEALVWAVWLGGAVWSVYYMATHQFPWD